MYDIYCNIVRPVFFLFVNLLLLSIAYERRIPTLKIASY